VHSAAVEESDEYRGENGRKAEVEAHERARSYVGSFNDPSEGRVALSRVIVPPCGIERDPPVEAWPKAPSGLEPLNE
jgi:hypothetical protein